MSVIYKDMSFYNVINIRKVTMRPFLLKIKKQFTADPFFFWLVIILMSVNPIASLLYTQEWVDLGITMSLVYCSACLLAIIVSCLGCVAIILKCLYVTCFMLYDVLALFCIIVFKSPLDTTIIETILETNINEIKEFIVVFVPWWLAVVIPLSLMMLLYVHHLCSMKYAIRMGDRQFSMHCYVLTYIVILLLICNKQVTRRIGSMGSWTIPFENIAINLKDYEPEHILLKESNMMHPEKIVLIIGESHSKGHSSIYGYDKETNPRIKRLMQDSLVFAFQNVTSPATATVQSFKYILNTRRIGDTKVWYESPSVITILKAAGYRASWFSNQDEVGLYDNMASCYAHICDEFYFNDTKERLDGDLICCHKAKKGKELVIYHLMGQHTDFSKRYPKTFSKFKLEHYDRNRYSKRDIAAHYDNACLYNDYVVSKIINTYKNDNAVVFYFPDHGLDVFQSSPDGFGHVRGIRANTAEIGYQIPFFVYTSRKYKEQNKEMVIQLQQSLQRKFCTADMTFTLMHIAGYDFEGLPSTRNYSLIQNSP